MKEPLFTNRCRLPLLILLAAILFCIPGKAKAQTTLATGDIAFTGYHSISGTGAGADTISFVLLKPISNGTRINFTDRGYISGSWFGTVGASEGSISWISSSAIAAGTEIILVGLQAYTYNPTTGVRTANGTGSIIEGTFGTLGLALASTGDQVIAYQSPGGAASTPQTAGNTMLAGIHYTTCNANTTAATWDGAGCTAGPNTSSMPPGLADGSSAMFIPTLPGNVTAACAKFNCTGTPATNAAGIVTAVYNIANWTRSATTISMASNCLFLSSGPVITGHPANRTVCVNGSTTFTVTASNPGTYQWQENNGGGFVDIPASAPFSGVTTATLTINPIAASRNGYQYRCRVTNGTSVNSNPGTLTVDVVSGTSSVTPVSCNGGSNGTATVTITSGQLPIASYAWSPSGGTSASASGLAANTYTCTITDNIGCTGTVQAIITEPAQPLSATITTVNNVSCPGGTNGNMTVTASGGTPGYTYLWNTTGTTASIFGLTAGTYTCTVRDSKNCPTTTSATVTAPPAFVTSSSTTPVSCNGGGNGTATVTVSSGGQPPYTYQWSASAGSQTTATATGLTAGTYSVTVRDNNLCPTVVSGITVSQPTDFTVGTSQTNVSCNGGNNGTATVAVSGATSPYTYSWSPSGGTSAMASGLAQGSYTVTITDNNTCQTTRSFNITQPAAALDGGITKTDVSCNGGNNGTATVSATGGTTPYSYSWAPSGGTNATAIGLAQGTYTVTVTDFNGCQITRTATVGQPAAALGGIITKTDVSCNGGNNGTATINANGGTTPYSYSWAPSGGTNATAIGLGQGTYTVTVTDFNGCQITRTTTVNQPAAALGGIITKTDVSCNGGNNGTATINANGGTTPYSYSWAPSGGTNATAIGLGQGTYTVTVTDFNGCQITRTTTVNQPAAALGGIISKTDVSCNGGNNGTATVSANGGTTPYSYSWAPSGGTNATATGLGQGTYTVTVTDFNGCQITRTTTVNQPAVALGGSISSTDVSCNGGSNGTATVSATGGTPGYTYSWAPSGGTAATASGLASGTYTVTVTDANACQITRTVTVNQPTDFTVGTSQTNVSCNGGSNGTATVNVSGATGPYTYSWSPSGGTAASASGLGAGTYTVTITDANTCQTTRSFVITEPTPFTVGTSQTNVSCNGGANGTATVSVSGATAPYTYSWSPSGGTNATATGLAMGTYTVTITDNNTCQTTRTFNITEPPVLDGTISKTDASCNGGANGTATVSVTGGTPAYTYSWAPSGGTAATATGLAAGTYTVTVTDANACQITRTITVGEPTAFTVGTSQTDVSCNGGANGTATVTVSGATGPYTYSWSPSGGTAATASGLAAGAYTVTITDANTCQTTRNFTIAQPTDFTVGTSQTNVSCNGGSNGTATVSVSGATAPYTYSWSPSGGTNATATGLAMGTYTVTITDNNTCQTTRTFNISQPTVLDGTISKTDASCNGGTNGTATVSVTGGTPGYTYSWSPSGGTNATATGLAAGTYTVTVTDANTCQITRTVTVGQPTAFTVGTSQTDVSCNGGTNGTATVTVSGATAPYSYSWSPSGGTAATASGLAAGAYTVTITDNNACQTTRNFTIAQPTAFTVGTSQTDVSCNGGTNGTATVSVSGATGPYTYSWSPSGGTAATASGLAAGTYTVTITDANTCQTTRSFTIAQPAVLVATPSQTNVSCHSGVNGTATVSVSGGTVPYTYSWSPSGGTNATATGLAAGTYTVTVTDNHTCQTTQTYTITEPTALAIASSSQTDILCNGASTGSATVTISGGTMPYGYSWSPSGGTNATASGLAAGTYTVTATDAHNCQITQSFTINQPTAFTVTTSKVDVLCNGAATGSATVNVSGATGPYTYSWSPSGGTAATATGLAAGAYTVTITDANTCQTTRNFTITQPTALSVTPSQTNILCNGAATGSATVAVTGGVGPYSYSWSPSGGTNATASGLVAGTYTVTITDFNLCTTTQSFTLTQPAALAVTTTQVDVLCNGASTGSATVTVTGGVGPYSYNWTPSGGTAATATGLAAGTYTCNITDFNSCPISATVTITQPTAIAITPSHTNVSCNGGTNGTATVTVTGGVGTYDYSWSPSGGTAATASGLAAGTYTVTVTDDNNCTATQSIVISQPTAFSVTPTSTNVLCHAGATGTAKVHVSGATGPYTYSWSPSGGTDSVATGLVAGTYTVTITDANTCSTTQSFTITEPATSVSIASSSQVNPICHGGNTGSATVVAAGGTGAYTYSWAPSGGTAATANGLGAGTYTVTVKDANLCSTTQTFTITEPAASTSSLTHTACDSYTLNGQTYTTSGTYTQNFTTATGCDSVLTLNLTVNNSTVGSLTETACDSYTLNGQTYTATGVYTQNLTNAAGCDSTLTLNLTINSSSSLSFAATACDSYTLNGQTYTTSGSYTQTMTNAAGCDWFVTVNLTINHSSSATLTQTACESYTLNGVTYDASGTYTQTLVNAAGCDSTLTLNLTIKQATSSVQNVDACKSYTYNGQTYTTSGTHSFTFTNAAGCDSTVTLNLTINNIDNGINQVGVTLTANLFGASYQWINCATGTAISGATSQSYTATANGTYAVIVTDDNCTDTSDCKTVNTVSITENEANDFSIVVHPNPTSDYVYIKTDAVIRTVEVMDISGKKYGAAYSVNKLDVTTLPSGVYLLRVTFDNGRQSVTRIIRL